MGNNHVLPHITPIDFKDNKIESYYENTEEKINLEKFHANVNFVYNYSLWKKIYIKYDGEKIILINKNENENLDFIKCNNILYNFDSMLIKKYNNEYTINNGHKITYKIVLNHVINNPKDCQIQIVTVNILLYSNPNITSIWELLINKAKLKIPSIVKANINKPYKISGYTFDMNNLISTLNNNVNIQKYEYINKIHKRLNIIYDSNLNANLEL